MVTLLTETHCDNWAKSISTVSATSFNSILAGMGSFSDVVSTRFPSGPLAVSLISARA